MAAIAAAPVSLGLRRANKLDSPAPRIQAKVAKVAPASRRMVTKCLADPSLVISASTGTLLALGRFVFLPFQREWIKKHGLPTQNGQTHFEAGDARAAEAITVFKTNDPAGFNLIDVMAYGALGHALGYAILASANIASS